MIRLFGPFLEPELGRLDEVASGSRVSERNDGHDGYEEAVTGYRYNRDTSIDQRACLITNVFEKSEI